MSETPWTVQRSKRKAPFSVPAVPKRVRLSNDPDNTPRQKQSTLTQIQFAEAPSSGLEPRGALTDDDALDRRRRLGVRVPQTKAPKRRSTLTQMNWFNHDLSPTEPLDDELLSLEDPEHTHADPKSKANDANNISTRQRRKKTYNQNRTVIPDSTDDEDFTDRQHRLLSNTTSKLQTIGNGRRGKQRRTRISTPRMQSTADPNEEVPVMESQENLQEPCQDTTFDGLNEKEHLSLNSNTTETCEHFRPAGVPTSTPQTPKRQDLKEVPSSQTPGSRISPRSRIQYPDLVSPSRNKQRTPLRERSVNLPLPTVLPHDTTRLPTKSYRRSARDQISLPQTHSTIKHGAIQQIEDSEDDGFALPSISPAKNTQHSGAHHLRCQISSMSRSSGILEIPESSQHHIDSGCHLEILEEEPITSQTEKPTANLKGTPKKMSHSDGSRSCSSYSGEEEDIDLGSPVANDTQFNEIFSRYSTSSPLKKERNTSWEITAAAPERPVELFAPSAVTEVLRHGQAAHELGEPGLDLTDHRREQRMNKKAKRQSQDVDNAQELPLDGDKSSAGDEVHLESPTGEVPHSPESSLPPLPTRFDHSEMLRPASLPRPSQTSTQFPTQFIPPSSSLNLLNDDDPEFDNSYVEASKHVTIHVSSPTCEQLCQADLSSQQQPLQSSRVLADSDEEEDDLDFVPMQSFQSTPARSKLPQSRGRRTKDVTEDIEATRQHEHTQDKQTSPERAQKRGGNLSKRRHQSDPDGNTDHSSSEMQMKDSNSADSILHTLSSSPIQAQQTGYIRKPIPGFNNETQSNFTQGGHVTAAYIHRQRETGMLPEWFIPQPYQLEAFRTQDHSE